LQVESVQQGSLADKKGIRKGDRIQILSENSELIRAIKSQKNAKLFASVAEICRNFPPALDLEKIGVVYESVADEARDGNFDSVENLRERLDSENEKVIGQFDRQWMSFFDQVNGQVFDDANDRGKTISADDFAGRLKTVSNAIRWYEKEVWLVRPKQPRLAFNVDADLPDRSIKVHPTQLYSSINAALIFLLLWAYFPFRKAHGEVFALMLIAYAITRFLLESIRIDEPTVGFTPFTISQLISFATLAVGVAVFVYVRKRFWISYPKNKTRLES